MNSGEPAIDGGPRKLRAFIALKTSAVWDEKLAELQRDLKSKFGNNAFRWVKPEQIHVTLRFFGWITLTEVDELTSLLPSICSGHQSFTLNCEGLGAFPKHAASPRCMGRDKRRHRPCSGASEQVHFGHARVR
ncbi:MAG: 2'-5' RNA ligase family protein [Limisphaerales bacterium]